MKTATLVLCLLACTPAVFAQVVYRCGNTYSQDPCAQARIIDVADPRSAAQQAEARRVAAEDQRLATGMQRDRLAAEAAQAPRVVVVKAGPARTAAGAEAHERRPPKRHPPRAKSRSTELSDPVIVAPAPPKRRASRV